MKTLPTTLPNVSVALDETGDFPLLTVTTGRKLSREEVSECHRLAGDHGAGIRFVAK